jgi:hypothetical protein
VREDLHRSAEQTQRRILESSRRTLARRRFIFKKALRWLKRHQPDVYEQLYAESYRKFPTRSGRRVKLKLAA